MMEETKELLRLTFETQNPLTIPISGTGSAGMETCFVNLLDEGDEAVIGINGVFGTRMADVVERAGGRPVGVEAPWGQIIDPADIAKALGRCRRPKLVAVVHAETSTGAWQPLEDISRLAHDAGALFRGRRRNLPGRLPGTGGCLGNRRVLQRNPEMSVLSPGTRPGDSEQSSPGHDPEAFPESAGAGTSTSRSSRSTGARNGSTITRHRSR